MRSMKIRFRDFLAGSAVLSAAMGMMLCIFEPLQLYFTNIVDYWFDIYNLLPVCLLMFAGVFAVSMVCFTVAYLIRHGFWLFTCVAYGVVFICTYVQGNYLAGNLPVLDGSTVDWDLYAYQRKYCVILWAAVISVTGLLLWKKGVKAVARGYKWLAVFVMTILAVTGIITGVTNEGFVDKGDLTITTDKFLSMSKDGKNYVILLLDSVRGKEMSELLAADESLRETFKDFTYYDNTMTGYPLTFYSVFYLMSGDWYECDEMIDDYRTRIMLEAPVFRELEERDYSMEMYTLSMPLTEKEGIYRFENLKKAQGKFASNWRFMKLEMRLVGLKYAPYDLKHHCLALPTEFNDLKVTEDQQSEIYTQKNEQYMQLLTGNMDYTEKNDFKFIHVEGAHTPFLYNRNVEMLSEETDYNEAVAAAATMAEAYIGKLKECGVYDNTVIIILSDHGYNPEPCDEYPYNPYDRQQGILFIKGFDEHHEEMLISHAPIAHGDLPEAYVKLMDGSRGDDVFAAKEGEARERRFLWHTTYDDLHLEEYIQTGEAGDMNTMIRTGRVYEWPDGLLEE